MLVVEQRQQPQVFLGLAGGTVVVARAGQACQLALPHYAEIRVGRVDPSATLLNRANQIFLSESASAFKRPIS